jgi:adenylate kinase
MLREEVSRSRGDDGTSTATAATTQLGLEIQRLIDNGLFVSDDVVVALVSQAIKQHPDCTKNGFILDGFPRTVEQAKLLDQVLLDDVHMRIDAVINLVVADEMLVKRITGRLIHTGSGRSYNIFFNPPKVKEGYDDETGEILTKRNDDTKEKLIIRLNEFHHKTRPILDHYRDVVVHIDADGPIDVVSKACCDAVMILMDDKDNKRLD